LFALVASVQREVTELKCSELLKWNVEELPAVATADDVIQLWNLLPSENIPNLKKCYAAIYLLS
jgi:hypothetical protein